MKKNNYLKSIVINLIFVLLISYIIPFLKAYLLKVNMDTISREQYPISYLACDFILTLMWMFMIAVYQTGLKKLANKIYILCNLMLAVGSFIEIILLLQRLPIVMMYNFYSTYMMTCMLIGLCVLNLFHRRHQS